MLKKIFLSDREILKRIKENDKTILGELYIANEKPVKSYILKNGGSADHANDYLQEAIIILWQKVTAEQLELTAKISTYIFSIAKNKWMAESRRLKKHDSNPALLDKQAEQENPLSIMIEADEKEAVRQALDEIGQPCRDILLMYYFEERKMNEIAKFLNFANGDVVKAKKYQCKKTLQKILESLIKK